MSKVSKAAKKRTSKTGAYLTKRIVASAAKNGAQKAARRAMNIMGHVVVAHDGWVVKQFADGSIQRLEAIPNSNTQVVLD